MRGEAAAFAVDRVLRDGGSIHVRAIRPDDKPRLLDHFGRLSARSVYFRFFRVKTRLTDDELRQFTELDFRDRVALVATLRNGADEQIVGVTITHELVHALQDQYANLDSLQKASTDNDRLAAAQALIEGEAQFEQLSIMLGGAENIEARLPGTWERIREEIRNRQGEMPVFATAPMVIQESLLFPYLSGAEFVNRVKEKKGNVNLFADIPRSTEQVMHPAKFLGTPADEPTVVNLPAPRGATKVYENDMGEFGTRLALYRWLKDAATSARAAEGWDGDRFMVVEGKGGTGFVWAIVWDSAIDAAEFSDALSRVVRLRTASPERQLPGGGATFASNGRTITIKPQSIGDRALVIYTDLPDAMGSTVVDPAGITLGK